MNIGLKKHKSLITAAVMFLFGAAMGIVSKLLDINARFLQITGSLNLANVLSEMSIWILLVTLLASIVVFDGPRVYDIVIMLVLAYFLFIHKVKR